MPSEISLVQNLTEASFSQLSEARRLLEKPERKALSPKLTFMASIALAVSALSFAGTMLIGPVLDSPDKAVAEFKVKPILNRPPAGAEAGFELSATPLRSTPEHIPEAVPLKPETTE
jgi:hypothetical protein